MKRKVSLKIEKQFEIMSTQKHCQNGCMYLNESHIITVCDLFGNLKGDIKGFILRNKKCLNSEE